jgi:hypothetical protein
VGSFVEAWLRDPRGLDALADPRCPVSRRRSGVNAAAWFYGQSFCGRATEPVSSPVAAKPEPAEVVALREQLDRALDDGNEAWAESVRTELAKRGAL